MKKAARAVLFALAPVVGGLLPTSVPNLQAAPPVRSIKTAVLSCGHGWRAGAEGQYGGVGFDLSCQNGRDRQRLEGVAGTAYSVRMGAESSAVALDCFFPGDAATVNETCGGVVRLTIQ